MSNVTTKTDKNTGYTYVIEGKDLILARCNSLMVANKIAGALNNATRLTALEQAAAKVATKDSGLVPDDFKVSYMIRAGDMRELAKLLNTEPK